MAAERKTKLSKNLLRMKRLVWFGPWERDSESGGFALKARGGIGERRQRVGCRGAERCPERRELTWLPRERPLGEGGRGGRVGARGGGRVGGRRGAGPRRPRENRVHGSGTQTRESRWDSQELKISRQVARSGPEPAASGHIVHAKRTGFGDQETTRRGRKENH
ncbi:M-phase phosphoprotein 6 isoform X2 [Vulpes vulpes]|uniref:M-phase phosphoprotein 6 isoform X2 n=1 Tax=Vulpes vulpes TaxID=9627 RepID=A0ABM4YB82_VULVU